MRHRCNSRDWEASGETSAQSQCDASLADALVMAEKTTHPAANQATARQSHVHKPDSATTAVWVTPAAVFLTADQVAAALYAFSELIDEYAHPTVAAVREEVRFLVARHGADEIEHVAELLAAHGPANPSDLTHASVIGLDRQLLPARLAWCRRQSQLLLAADA
jgi:hypothetical protein